VGSVKEDTFSIAQEVSLVGQGKFLGGDVIFLTEFRARSVSLRQKEKALQPVFKAALGLTVDLCWTRRKKINRVP
jgi:hypothetical protein